MKRAVYVVRPVSQEKRREEKRQEESLLESKSCLEAVPELERTERRGVLEESQEKRWGKDAGSVNYQISQGIFFGTSSLSPSSFCVCKLMCVCVLLSIAQSASVVRQVCLPLVLFGDSGAVSLLLVVRRLTMTLTP